MWFSLGRRASPHSLAFDPKIEDVKPQDIGGDVFGIAMPKKWAASSNMR